MITKGGRGSGRKPGSRNRKPAKPRKPRKR